MSAFRGAIFDVDGVLVDSPHEKAWRESLRQLMEPDWSDIRNRTSWSPEAFTSRVYEEQMSGAAPEDSIVGSARKDTRAVPPDSSEVATSAVATVRSSSVTSTR